MKNILFSLRTQIFLNILIIMIATVALLGILMLKMAERDILEEKVKSGKAIVSSIARDMTVSAGETEGKAGSWRVPDTHPYIDNFSLKDISVLNPASPGTGALNPGAEKALATGETVVEIGRDLTIYSPVRSGNTILGAISVVFSLDEVRARIGRSQKLALLYLPLLTLIPIILGGYLFSRAVTRPVDRLVEATEKIAEGKFDHRVEVSGRNELDYLARSFNTMVEKVKDQMTDLRQANQKLTRAEEEVIRSEKLASLGRMAAGIAHDLGNPVSALTGYLDILLKGTRSQEKEGEILKRSYGEVQRMDRIIKGLLEFSRPKEARLEEVDVNEVVRNTMSILTPQKALDGIDVTITLAENLPPARANASVLTQVILNMVLNSKDAMPSGGALTLTTGTKDGSLEIVISDTGSGIRKEDLPRIFDPFYTTKEPGKGIGLGLSICQRAVDSFGGRILVESEWKKGSSFTILLPVTSYSTRDGGNVHAGRMKGKTAET